MIMVFIRMSEDINICDSDVLKNNQSGACTSSTQHAVEPSTKCRVEEKKSETIELVQCHSVEDSFKCSVEFPCQYTESKLLGQSMVEEFGTVGRISPDCMSMDSSQEQMRPDECGENAMIGVTDFSFVNETTNSAVDYSAEPLRESHDQCQFPQSQDHVGFTTTIECSTESQKVLPTGHISTDSITASNLEQKRSDCTENAVIGEMDFSSAKEATNSAVVYSEEPLIELHTSYQNAQSQDCVAITDTIESSSECQGVSPTGHIFTDSIIEQKNLPFENRGVNSNGIMALPSENKDTTSQIDRSAESPSDVFEDLVLQRIKETPKSTVESPSHPLEHRSEIDENIDEIVVVESLCREDLLLHGDASVNSSWGQSGSRMEDLGVNSSLNNIEVLDERGETILIVNHSVEVLGDASESTGQELRDGYQNAQSQDCVAITDTIESSEGQGVSPTGHIITDSVIEQKNLPFENCGVNSNSIMGLPSENKDNTSQIDRSAESPRDVFEDLVLEQIKESPKSTVESPSHPLEHRSEIDENIDEIVVVESLCREDLLLHGDASVNSSWEHSGSRMEDLGVNSNVNNIEVLDERGEAILIVNHSVELLGDASESTGQELRDGYQNAQSQDCVAITDTIESSEGQGVSPTGHIITDSVIEQNNLPFENCGVNSNSIMGLPSENKDNTSQIDRSAESPRDVFEDLVLEQIKETPKSTVESPSHPLEHRSEIDENKDEIMVVESLCRKDLLLHGDASINSSREQSGSRMEDLGVNSSLNNIEVLDERGEAIPIANSVVVLGVASESTGQELREMYRDSSVNPSQLDCGDESHSGQSRKKISSLRSLVSSTRVLRSRTQEKTKSPETTNASAADNSNKEKKRKRRKRKQRKHIAANELLGIKSHLKYLVRRIQYEQSLIDAYSGEGWKGQSLEKLKPEKELQRAKSGIFHYKLKLRELFSRIDASLSDGQFPESLFDSEGQIDSEDIFCAKCSSKNVSANNDIILCDGACERGFHQKCLEPPLLKEEFPPDDEGWLCPGCDCKVDCVDLLNDLLGTDLSITDSWEKVFQEEAAAAASGKQLDDMAGLPSDDSEDDDYNPDNLEVDEKISQDDESDSDNKSDSSDMSFELETPNDELLLGLPSEDSEDDDYEPDAPEHDEQIMQYSSSSDFTSDSEDFSVELKNIMSLGQEDRYEKIEVGGGPHSLKGEVEFLMQSYETLASGKRHVERLDYKKLHDETFGVASSDSSDEDYVDNSASKNRKKRSDKAVLKSPVQSPVDTTVKNASRTSSKKRKAESLVESESGSSSKRNTRLKYGDDVIKRLYESFKENHYPKQEVKESLAKELGLTVQQVSRWFNNTRWSFNHLSPQTKNAMHAVEKHGEKHSDHQASQKPKKTKPQVDKKKSSLPVRRRNRLNF